MNAFSRPFRPSTRPALARRRRLVERLRRFEPLEPRWAMSSDLDEMAGAAALTLSFAPDGASVAGDPNALYSTFQNLGEPAVWQAQILRAFQTWARHADLNIGVVADEGDAFGVRGLAHGDSRFGDIRIGAAPLSDETWAEAIDERRAFVGSWTGDVLFNSNRAWNSLDDLFAVALHEAGHVLGLPHSADPNSPMFVHGVTPRLEPTADDIELLQTLYGARIPDEQERDRANDEPHRATSVDNAEPDDGYDGTAPLVEFGDLHASTDVDWFELPVLPGYEGTLKLELRSRELSLLRPRLTLFDRQDRQLGQASSDSPSGGVASVELSGPFDERVYIRIDSTADQPFDVGGYALIASYVDLDASVPSDVDAAIRTGFRWRSLTDEALDQLDLGPLLRGDDDPHFDDDGSTDDDAASGRALEPTLDNSDRRQFQTVASIGAPGDVDHYRLQGPTFASDDFRHLTVVVESFDLGGVIADVELLDRHEQPLPYEVIADGAGVVMVRLADVASNAEIVVRVRTGESSAAAATGNYALRASFDRLDPGFQTLAAGAVSPSAPEAASTLYVARTQLFSFALDSKPDADSADAVVWAVLLDSLRRPVVTLAAPAGETRSGPGVLLEPGEYSWYVSSRQPDGLAPAGVEFTLRGRAASDPVGPPVVDPGSTPIYACPAEQPTSPYCYPGGVASSDPYVVVPGSTPGPGTFGYAVVNPGDGWFWTGDFSRTNPESFLDVFADGTIAPIDALLVINYINEHPTGALPTPPVPLPYLDVNADGVVAPIDALLIINQLNLPPQGEGEAPAAASLRLAPLAELDAPAAENGATGTSPSPPLAAISDSDPFRAAGPTTPQNPYVATARRMLRRAYERAVAGWERVDRLVSLRS